MQRGIAAIRISSAQIYWIDKETISGIKSSLLHCSHERLKKSLNIKVSHKICNILQSEFTSRYFLNNYQWLKQKVDDIPYKQLFKQTTQIVWRFLQIHFHSLQ